MATKTTPRKRAKQAGLKSLPKKQPDSKCNGRKTDGSGYCGRPAGWGTDHPGFGRCKRHGGATKLGEQGGKREAQEAAAKEAVGVYGLPVQTDPHTALLQELERTLGHVSWLFIKVNEVGTGPEGDNALVGPVGTEGESRESGQYAHPSVEPSIWLRLYQEERKHLVSVARACAAAGVEERRVRIAEAQGMLIARAIQNIVTRLGVQNHPELAKIVREELTQLSNPDPNLASQPLDERFPALEAAPA